MTRWLSLNTITGFAATGAGGAGCTAAVLRDEELLHAATRLIAATVAHSEAALKDQIWYIPFGSTFMVSGKMVNAYPDPAQIPAILCGACDFLTSVGEDRSPFRFRILAGLSEADTSIVWC